MEKPRKPGRNAGENAWEIYYSQKAEYDRLQFASRLNAYQQATSRPEGVQEAGNVWLDGHPAYYEDGGTTGRPGHRDRYSGPNGPFGPEHTHDGSKDGGNTWERYH